MTHHSASASLLGFGSALVDVLVHVSESELRTVIGAGLKGGTELVSAVEQTDILSQLPQTAQFAPGGAAANTIVGYAQLGGQAALLAKIGDDDAGRFYQRSLQDCGVTTNRFKTAIGEPTGRCLSLITPDSERTMRTSMGAAATLLPEELSAADFAGHGSFYLEGYTLFNRQLMLRVLQLAQAAAMPVYVDLASPEVVRAAQDVLPELLRQYVQAIFANELEAAMLSGSNDPLTALAMMTDLCPLAVVKVGRDGAWLQERGGQPVHVPAKVVPAVDTTGAGDLWAAGFLYGWLRGWNLTEAGELGAATAAEVVQVTGAAIPEDGWSRLRHHCQNVAATRAAK